MNMKNKQFQNPILSGFYPDPSICRVGEDYYLVNSSFVYFPGLPIFHSRDLVHWEQIGYAITRENTFDYQNCETSLGLWAPTIRYHEGTFYIVNTFVSGGREVNRDNFIITASHPAGPWSKPVFIKGADGIDPSLFFDDDGRMWYAGNFIFKNPLYEGHHGIYLCELDRKTFQFIGERTVIWDGNRVRGKWSEAPHIYKKDDHYYLMIAEGGTFVEHSVMMARAEKITGPYEPCPRNPILTHRHLPLDHVISVVGHGDLVKTQNDEWWMVVLGVRNYHHHHFNTGRETYLVPMIWEDGDWPMVGSENGLVNEKERIPDLPAFLPIPRTGCDQFEEKELAFMWNTIHPPVRKFYSLEERPGYLRIYLQPEIMEEISSPAFIGRRQEHREFILRTVMEFIPASEKEEAGISLVQDDRYHYHFLKGKKGEQQVMRLWKVEAGNKTLMAEKAIENIQKIYLSVVCRTANYYFYYGFRENEFCPVAGEQPAEVLSSWENEGFTGAYLGMYATAGHSGSENMADFDWFLYEAI